MMILDAIAAQQERIKRSAKWRRHEALETLRAANKDVKPRVYVGRKRYCEQCGSSRLDYIHYKLDTKRPDRMVRLTSADAPVDHHFR